MNHINEGRIIRVNPASILAILPYTGRPAIIWRAHHLDDAGVAAIERMVHLHGHRGPVLLAIDLDTLGASQVALPPDHYAELAAGRPLLLEPIALEPAAPHGIHRSPDPEVVVQAKAGLEAEAFRVREIQAAVEQARARAQITIKEAQARADERLVMAAMPREDASARGARWAGLVDRGRRRIAALYGVAEPRYLTGPLRTAVKRIARRRPAALSDLEADGRGRIADLARYEQRAAQYAGAMRAWTEHTQAGTPLPAWLVQEIGNALTDRLGPVEAVLIALHTEIDPASVLTTLRAYSDELDLARRVGQLGRGAAEITLEPRHAAVIAHYRVLHDLRCLDTHEGACASLVMAHLMSEVEPEDLWAAVEIIAQTGRAAPLQRRRGTEAT